MKHKGIILLLFMILIIPFSIAALVEKSGLEYVTDEGNLLTSESENYIVRYSDFLYKKKQIDYYVVTVKSLEDKEIEDYAEEVYKSFKIHKKGVLIFVAKEERQVRILSGEKLSDLVTEEVMDEVFETYFTPLLERNEWDEGLMNGYKALYKYICEKNGIDATSMEVVYQLDFLTKYASIITFVLIIAVSIIGSKYVYFYKVYKIKNMLPLAETIQLGSILIFNIFIIALTYYMKPVYALILLACEGVAFYSSSARKMVKKEKKVRIRKKPYRKSKKNIAKIRRRK